MPDPTDNGDTPPPVQGPPAVIVQQEIAFQFTPTSYDVLVAQGPAPILLILRMPVGLIGVMFDPDGAANLASSLHKAQLQARTGLTIAKDMPREDPPRG